MKISPLQLKAAERHVHGKSRKRDDMLQTILNAFENEGEMLKESTEETLDQGMQIMQTMLIL